MKKNKKAIALGYDGYTTPKITSKGYQQLAEKLVEDMKKQGGLVHQDEVLVQWLDKLAVGEDIPEPLFLVIAELIAFAWYLDGKTPPGWEGLNETI